MKAACLLLCLALAQLATGHIFRRQYNPQMDSLIVQPVDYIRQQEYQPSSEERSREAQGIEQKLILIQNPRSFQRAQQYREPQQYEEYQGPQQNQQPQQYEQMLDVPQKHQIKQNKQKSQQKQKYLGERQTQDSVSTEIRSQDTSYKNNQYAAPVNANVQDMDRLYSARMQQENMKPVHGDAVAWRGVQIAEGTKHPVMKEDIEKIFSEAYNTMNHVSKENQKIFHENYVVAAQTNNEDIELNATQLLSKNQYGVETHTIKTDDGYFLTMFRIAPKESTIQPRPVVFMMHGLLGSADDWLLMGPGKSLAYLLADAGYDVWLGNARGNKYSRRHVSKHHALTDFWQFGTDEIALHDLPTMIDYVLKTSQQQRMYYVGYSMGTTAFFALASERPEYNDKIIMMYAMSPMAYMTNARSPLFRMIAPNSQFSELLQQQLGYGEFMPTSDLVQTVGGVMCENEIGCKNVCSNVNFVMSGASVESLDVNLIPVIIKHLPAGGASTRQMRQIAQAVASNEFTKYDFGADVNMKVYGQSQPTKYDMVKVKVPISLYYSEEDWLAHPRDVERLALELPNVQDLYKVPEPHFASMDFQFSRNAPEVVYKRLIESINQHNKNYVY